MKTIAVLFARADSVYKAMPGCEDGFPIWRGVGAISLAGYTITHWAVLPKGPKS